MQCYKICLAYALSSVVMISRDTLEMNFWTFQNFCHVVACTTSPGLHPHASPCTLSRVFPSLVGQMHARHKPLVMPVWGLLNAEPEPVTGFCRRSLWRSTIRRHHPPQRAVLSQICCFRERKMVMLQILLNGAEPCDAGTSQLSSPVCL